MGISIFLLKLLLVGLCFPLSNYDSHYLIQCLAYTIPPKKKKSHTLNEEMLVPCTDLQEIVTTQNKVGSAAATGRSLGA